MRRNTGIWRTSIVILAVTLAIQAFSLCLDTSSQSGDQPAEEPLAAHALWSPPANTWVWSAPEASNANNASNWNPVSAPSAGGLIVFNSTSVYNCSWDLNLALGSFTIASGYIGNITQTVAYSVTSFLMEDGAYIGGQVHWLTDSGDFTQTGGSIVNLQFCLKMTGTNKVLKMWSTGGFWLNVSGSVTVNPDSGIINQLVYAEVAGGATMSIATGDTLRIVTAANLWNNGTINGPGLFEVYCNHNHVNWIFGHINAPFKYGAVSWQNGDSYITAFGKVYFGSTVNIVSSHATYTAVLDLGPQNNDMITVNGITLETRGILRARGGSIFNTGNMEMANGTFEHNTSSVYQNGAGNYIKLASGQRFHNLQVNSTGTRIIVPSSKLADNLTVLSVASASISRDQYVRDHLRIDGALMQNGYDLNISGTSSRPLEANGTFNGMIGLNGTASRNTVYVAMPFQTGGHLMSDHSSTLIDTDASSLNITFSAGKMDLTVLAWAPTGGAIAAKWSCWVSSPGTSFSYMLSGFIGNHKYDAYVDDEFSGFLTADVNGNISFEHITATQQTYELSTPGTHPAPSTPTPDSNRNPSSGTPGGGSTWDTFGFIIIALVSVSIIGIVLLIRKRSRGGTRRNLQ